MTYQVSKIILPVEPDLMRLFRLRNNSLIDTERLWQVYERPVVKDRSLFQLFLRSRLTEYLPAGAIFLSILRKVLNKHWPYFQEILSPLLWLA